MAFKHLILLACVSSVAFAQQGARSDRFSFEPIFEDGSISEVPTTTPIPILRFLDTQNPDGSYTYGYESGDGTYKIETRYTNGEVKGKYGYYDDLGTFREVEYGAHTGGFIPSGEGLITPEISVSEPVVAPQPIEQPAAAVIPTPTPSRSSGGGGRRVVLRRRPAAAKKQAADDAEPLRSAAGEQRFAHFDRVSIPSQRANSAPRRASRPAVAAGEQRKRPVVVRRRKPAARPAAPEPQVAQALPERPRFNPVQPAAQPAVQVPLVFGASEWATSSTDLNTGSFSFSYSG